MIIPIYRGCTACFGEGVIETRSHPSSSTLTKTPSYSIKCEACEGVGAIPTGDFIIEESPFESKKTLIDQINELSEIEQRVIKAKLIQ